MSLDIPWSVRSSGLRNVILKRSLCVLTKVMLRGWYCHCMAGRCKIFGVKRRPFGGRKNSFADLKASFYSCLRYFKCLSCSRFFYWINMVGYSPYEQFTHLLVTSSSKQPGPDKKKSYPILPKLQIWDVKKKFVFTKTVKKSQQK